MAHNSVVRVSWVNDSAIFTTEFAKFDRNLTQAINGVDGGAYAPENEITINGNGVQFTTLFRLWQGGVFQPTASGSLVLDDNDYPEYSATHTGRQRTIVYPCMAGKGYPRVGWRARFGDGGMQAVAGTIDISDGNGPQPLQMWVPLRCHDQSTLTTITLNFRIGFPHTDIPPTMPKARVVRMSNADAATIETLTSVAAGATGIDGYVPAAPPSSVAAWTGQQSIAITCDQNNFIDVSQYEYFVEIFEETGLTGYPWSLLVKPSVSAASTANLTATSPVDGVSIPTTYLAKEQTASSLNGVYSLTGSPAEGYSQASDMPQGVVVPVDLGNANGGTYWQMSSAIEQWSGVPTTQPNIPNWTANTTYGFASYVLPTPANANGFLFFGTTNILGGVSGSSEPAWPLTVGAAVTDGTMLWTNIGPLSRTPSIFVTRAQGDDETPYTAGFGFYAHGNIYQSITAQFVGITDGHFQ
jgi:hypothetical protein